MKINCIATGSSGNALTVSDGQSTLLLDAGIPYKELARQVRVSELSGVLITHEHQDHAKAVLELLRRGVRVYMSGGTEEKLDLEFHPFIVRHGHVFTSVSMMIAPFNVIHDCEEPLGFVIWSKVLDEVAVYIVDTGIVEYDFERVFGHYSPVNYWLLEANYAEDILEESDVHEARKRRTRKYHMGLEDVKTLLRTSDLSKAEEIWLLHLSDRHSDEARFVSEIQKLTGVPTYAPPSRTYTQKIPTTASGS